MMPVIKYVPEEMDFVWRSVDSLPSDAEKVLVGLWHQGEWYSAVGNVQHGFRLPTVAVGFRRYEFPTHWARIVPPEAA
jgi:hypothetical protein